MVKPGAVVVDVGINFVDGKMVGDVDFAGVSSVAGAVTPVPGGVGTVTSTVVVKHVVQAAERAAAG
jgi:methylenetetrahydrofolate dehydrogenase (NADP+)/methenyltetrahydrofolate cyclohydrolase